MLLQLTFRLCCRRSHALCISFLLSLVAGLVEVFDEGPVLGDVVDDIGAAVFDFMVELASDIWLDEAVVIALVVLSGHSQAYHELLRRGRNQLLLLVRHVPTHECGEAGVVK